MIAFKAGWKIELLASTCCLKRLKHLLTLSAVSLLFPSTKQCPSGSNFRSRCTMSKADPNLVATSFKSLNTSPNWSFIDEGLIVETIDFISVRFLQMSVDLITSLSIFDFIHVFNWRQMHLTYWWFYKIPECHTDAPKCFDIVAAQSMTVENYFENLSRSMLNQFMRRSFKFCLMCSTDSDLLHGKW